VNNETTTKTSQSRKERLLESFESFFHLDSSYKARRKRQKTLFITMMLMLPIAHFLVFFVYVNIDTILLAFQRYDYRMGDYRYVGFDNFQQAVRDLSQLPQMRQAIVNSLLFLPVTNFITLPLSIITAYFLFRKVPGRNIFKVIFFLPSIISIVVLTMAFQFMFDPLFGPINGLLESIGISPVGGWFGSKDTAMNMIYFYCIWAGIGFNMVIINGAISRLPSEVIESGRIDGVGMFRELVQIVVPMIWPTITTLFVLGSISVFTIFLQVLLLTNGGPSGSTKTISFLVVEMVQSGDLTTPAAYGVIFTLIGIPFIMGIKWFMERIGQSVEY
jgi:ABC-type sugar transport system permease subunit